MLVCYRYKMKKEISALQLERGKYVKIVLPLSMPLYRCCSKTTYNRYIPVPCLYHRPYLVMPMRVNYIKKIYPTHPRQKDEMNHHGHQTKVICPPSQPESPYRRKASNHFLVRFSATTTRECTASLPWILKRNSPVR